MPRQLRDRLESGPPLAPRPRPIDEGLDRAVRDLQRRQRATLPRRAHRCGPLVDEHVLVARMNRKVIE